jgi:hypothetical protein
MNDVDAIKDYLAKLSQQPPFRGRGARRILREIGDHLREAADELHRQGMDPAAAASKAVERFGSQSELCKLFDLESPIESEEDAMIRYLLMSVAGLSFAFGGVFLVCSGFDDARHAMFISKLVASAIIMACSLTIFYQGWTTKPLANWQRGLALASALMSIAIGSAGGVFTAHLGLVTQDWEMYGFVGAGLLVLQGVLAAMNLMAPHSPGQRLTA